MTTKIARVYAYGGLAPIKGCGYAQAETQRQHALWNRLVEIDREHDHRIWQQACQDDESIQALSDEIHQLSQTIGGVIQQRRDLRSAARKKIDTPDIDTQLDSWVPSRRAKRRELWDKLSTWRKSYKETVAALNQWRRAECKLARQRSGCYWSNYNRVLVDYETARKNARKKGRRLHPFDENREDGILTCQIIRTKTGLGAAWDELFGTLSAVKFEPVSNAAYDPSLKRGQRKRLCRSRLTMRIDALGNTLTLPVMLHRRVPDASRIKSVSLTWKREGERLRYQVNLTLSMPAIDAPSTSTGACGIDFGWRLQPDGSLLIATLMDTQGQLKRYHLPKDWMSAMDQVERLHQHIDEATLYLCEQLPAMGLRGALAKPFERWRKGLGARHVDCAGLHDAIRQHRPNVSTALLDWYKRYRHLLLWRDNLRAKLLRRRREVYRLIAREIAAHYGVIAADKMDLSQMARTKKREDGSDPGLHAQARAQRQRACIHELRDNLIHQAGKHGAKWLEVKGATTMVCHVCGTENRPFDKAARIWQCKQCAATWDQDYNAANNILATAVGDASTDAVDAKGKRKIKTIAMVK